MQSVMIAVVTSLAASIIFWLFFQYIPERQRYVKVRSKVEFDIYDIYFQTWFYLCIALDNYSLREFPESRLRAGSATKEDFELWLQNKCLNDSYRFDEFAGLLIPVGEKLQDAAKEICGRIERCSIYHFFLTAEEILLLRGLSERLTVYEYDSNAVSAERGHVFRTVVPNIAYMAENFFEIYQLWQTLQQIVWKYRRINTSINKVIMDDFVVRRGERHYLRGEYGECLRVLRRHKSSDALANQGLRFQTHYRLGELDEAWTALRSYLTDLSLELVYVRNTFADIYLEEGGLNPQIRAILGEYCEDSEIDEMTAEIDRENQIHLDAIKRNKHIAEHYRCILNQSN